MPDGACAFYEPPKGLEYDPAGDQFNEMMALVDNGDAEIAPFSDLVARVAAEALEIEIPDDDVDSSIASSTPDS